jgi:hypothetical protein
MTSSLRNGTRVNFALRQLGMRLLATSLAVLCAGHLSHPLWGQTAAWQANGSVLSTPAGSLIGIGTTTPKAPLDVNGVGVVASGNWNVHTVARFSDGGAITHSAILFDTGGSGPTATRGFRINKTSQDFFITRFDSTGAGNPTDDLAILSNGNVGIGTMIPQYKLSVNGTIQAKEVIVNTGWSDYVFDPEYRLTPLREIAAYVKENHHLPEIPSASEVAEKGIGLGEMESKLLAKVEELTLHMIHADEKNTSLEHENLDLREQNRLILDRLGRLEERGVNAKQ